MDIKIGFTNSNRELAVTVKGDKDAIIKEISDNLRSESGTPILEVEDTKGRTYVIRYDSIAYVEFGNEAPRSVGFA